MVLGTKWKHKKRRKPIAILFIGLNKKVMETYLCMHFFLKDQEMRERILAMITFFLKGDPFAVDIHYQKECWDKHISNISTKKRQDHVECITKWEVDAVFIDHVQRTICQLNEPQTSKCLLNDYQNFLFDLRGEEKEYKRLYIKDLIY